MEDDKHKLAELAELCGLRHEKIHGAIHVWIYNTDMADWVAWNPFTNIEHAMMVLKTFDIWKIECVDDLYFCQISKLSERCDGYEILGAVQLETLCEAICYACLCAKEKEG